MQRKRAPHLAALLAGTVVAGVLAWWLWPRGEPEDGGSATETPIVPIALRGGPEERRAEISGLAWHGERLVLLPQYPARFGDVLFTLPRSAIEDALDGRTTAPLEVRRMAFDAPGLEEALPGFDGFEAIAFAGDDAYFAVEARPGPDPERTVGYLLRGQVTGSPEKIRVVVEQRARLTAQTDLPNTGYEAIVVHGERVYALYEVNDANNRSPRVLVFDRSLAPLQELPLARMEYRVTDATEMEDGGRFWVANYHWPGSPWQPGACQITQRHGRGASHARCRTVERLVELRATDRGVAPTDRAPILLELVGDDHARNWEGLVRLPGRGFLIMTDEHPESILAFVPESP